MHDIICPNCGERFLGYDVAFDLSSYILPMLYSNIDDEEAVKQVQFKYYVDEEAILKSNKSESKEYLRCTNPGGPGFGDQTFSFHVTGRILYDYIFEKSGFDSREELDAILKQLSMSVEDGDFGSISPLQLSQISSLYHVLFGVSDKLVGDISISDEFVRTAIKILVHIFQNKDNKGAQNKLDLKVAIFSYHVNGKEDYYVPDLLFIKNAGNFYSNIKKCCRFCGRPLPTEFGYYKMKPVVLLGSHSSGKTSFLLSLLNTVMTGQPFINNGSPVASTPLNNDFNLKAFNDNIHRFQKGLAPVKTDFENVPILNLRVADTIYSFIDWPGEKFISGAGIDDDYVYRSKRVITRARHIMFFLPPEQIDPSLPTPEEEVCFDIMGLGQSLSWHVNFPEKRRFRSILYVANKVDALQGRANTDHMFNLINSKNELNIFNGSGWQQKEFDEINGSTAQYITQQNPALFNTLNNVNTGSAAVEKYYLPVSPYGYDTAKSSNEEDSMVIHRGFLAGLPYLRILKTDGVIR